MSKQLGTLSLAAGLILFVFALVYFDIPVVREWLPVTLSLASILVFVGVRKYREV